MTAYTELPDDLPVPADDGACHHLTGSALPGLCLNTTTGHSLDLATLAGKTVLYLYPMTGQPGVPLPQGWDDIPGARGCTPQSCAFRDHQNELARLQAQVYGISAQSSEYQAEVRQRLHLPYELLSDQALLLKAKLRLPTFHVDGMELYKRLTLICENSTIIKVFYPVFPPDRNAQDVINWLHQNTSFDHIRS